MTGTSTAFGWSLNAGSTHPPPSTFFRQALSTLKVTPSEVVTDAAPVYPRCA
jgi:hypothetical protein